MMAVIIVAAKALGLLRDVLVAGTYGTSSAAVAYETASRLPVLIFDFVIGGVVSAAFIPVFNEILVRDGRERAMRYAASYVNMIFCLSGAVTLLGVLGASPLVRVLAPALAPDTAALAVSLTRMMFPMVICTGLAYSFVGILQSMGEFRIPALISLVSNLIMVAYLVLFRDRFGIYGLAAAMLLGWAAQALVQIPRLRSFGFRVSLRAGVFSSEIARSLKLALPILLGTWTQPLCSVINTRFASAIENGRAITALGYANRLYTILVGVFSFVATNLLFPYFSRAAASGDLAASRRLMVVSARVLSYIIAPIAAGVAVLAEPVSALIYERGEFTAADTAMTAEALRFYAAGMLFMAVGEVLTKAFFAEGRPKIPMWTSIAATAANFALVAWLSHYGIGGIALASGAATALQCVLNAAVMCRIAQAPVPRAALLDAGKSVLAALAMGVAVHFAQPVLPGGTVVRLALSVLLGAAVYAALTALLASEETRFLLSKIIRRKGGDEA